MALLTAASQTAMLALSASEGDECFRPDVSRLYLLAGPDPAILGDWTEVKTIGEQIIEKVVAILTAGLPGVLVANQRLRPFEQSELPAVNVKLGNELVTYTGAVKRTSQGASRVLHILARMEAAGDPPALDALRFLVSRTLLTVKDATGKSDRSLGGLAIGIGEYESEWEYEAGSDATNGVCTTTFEVQYATETEDATVKLG